MISFTLCVSGMCMLYIQTPFPKLGEEMRMTRVLKDIILTFCLQERMVEETLINKVKVLVFLDRVLGITQ